MGSGTDYPFISSDIKVKTIVILSRYTNIAIFLQERHVAIHELDPCHLILGLAERGADRKRGMFGGAPRLDKGTTCRRIPTHLIADPLAEGRIGIWIMGSIAFFSTILGTLAFVLTHRRFFAYFLSCFFRNDNFFFYI